MAKVNDVVGLYLDPPEKGVVICVDEKPPGPGSGPYRPLPLRLGLPERATHDYVCHGTTTSFAALVPRPVARCVLPVPGEIVADCDSCEQFCPVKCA